MNMQKLFASAVFSAGLITAGLAGFPAAAFAGSQDSTFQITATVEGSCSVTANDVSLGTYDPGASTLEGTGTIDYQCTPGLSPTISLNDGLYGVNPYSRILSTGSSSLDYQLYQDAGYSTVWGDGTDGASVESVTADGNSDSTTVYVAIPSGQTNAAAGSYSDTVTATINW